MRLFSQQPRIFLMLVGLPPILPATVRMTAMEVVDISTTTGTSPRLNNSRCGSVAGRIAFAA